MENKFYGIYYDYRRGRVVSNGRPSYSAKIAKLPTSEVPFSKRHWGVNEEELRAVAHQYAERHIFGDTGCNKFFLRKNYEDRNFTLDLMELIHKDRLDYILANPNGRNEYNLGLFNQHETEQEMKERIFAGASWILSEPCQDSIQHEVDNNTMTRAQAIEVMTQYIISQDEPVAIDTNCDLNIPVVLVETETLEEKGARNYIPEGTFPDNAFFIKRISVLDFNDWTAKHQVFSTTSPSGDPAMLPEVEGLPGSNFYIQPNQYVVITVTDTAGNIATKRIDYPVMEDNSEDSSEDEGES